MDMKKFKEIAEKGEEDKKRNFVFKSGSKTKI